MRIFTLLTNVAGEAILMAGLCILALALVGAIYRRQLTQNRRLSTAVNNMSQGLNVFDGHGRITLLNQRYLEMYQLSPDVVKPGCSLQQLIQHRKDTGLFAGDVLGILSSRPSRDSRAGWPPPPANPRSLNP